MGTSGWIEEMTTLAAQVTAHFYCVASEEELLVCLRPAKSHSLGCISNDLLRQLPVYIEP